MVWVCFFTVSSAELSSLQPFSRVGSLISGELLLIPRYKFPTESPDSCAAILGVTKPGVGVGGISGLRYKIIVFLLENSTLLL